MRRLIAVVAVAGLVASACGGDDEASITPAPSAAPPPTTMIRPSPESTVVMPPEEPSLAVYFVLDGVLAVVPRSIGVLDARAALEAMLAGPTPDEAAVGYESAVPAGTRVLDVSIDGRVATVDLTSEFTTGGGSLSMMSRVAQVVYTVTQFGDADAVRFAIDGEAVSEIGGEGLMVDGVGRLDLPDVLPFLMVDRPLPGDTATSPIVVSGVANVFEGTVYVQVIGPDGAVLVDEFTTATTGSGEWGTFEHTVGALPDGFSGPIVVHVFEASSDTGAAVNVVDVPLQV